MRNWAAALTVALLFGVCGSCAAISGLEGYSQGACPGECDADPDRAISVHPSADALAEVQTQADDATVEDGEAGEAAALEGPDGGSEGGAGSGDDGSPDAGCVAVDGSVSCAACAFACDTTTGAPSCTASTCTYACNTTRHDCNASKAPDTDGCECEGTGCCSGMCQTAHSNANGQMFYDCNALKTYDKAQATEACVAVTGDSGACSAKSVNCGCAGFCGPQAQSICASSGSNCYCWQYSGPNPGTLQKGSGMMCFPGCGSSSDPTWN